MSKQSLILFCIILFTFSYGLTAEKSKDTSTTDTSASDTISECQQYYNSMNLDNIVNYNAFRQAFLGYKKLNAKNKDILTVIDFSLPSTEKRFYVLDMKNKTLLFVSYVAHGKQSGENYAVSFSNRSKSHQSSLGFYITENTYMGGNGYSLVLNGLEKGINDNAKRRSIVIHGADYCDESYIPTYGRLGRSYGCPALPRKLNKPIINTIKDGTILYIYADNTNYAEKTSILKGYTQAHT